jgi:UDP:flavonoid glycosyltransferase YjiC (YdhE family)
MLRVVADRMAMIVDAVEPHVKWADVMLTHPIAALTTTIPCEIHGVPWIVGDLFPMLLPSGAEPISGAPNLGRRANMAGWKMARSPVLDRLSGAHRFKAFRRSRGLDDTTWNLVDARSSPYLNLGLVSPHYVDEQPDWPQPYQLTGFTCWDGPNDYALPQDVVTFLDDGSPPLAVTFGTSAAAAHPELFAKVATALDRHGCRGLFLTSTADIASALSATVDRRRHGVWPFVPLGPLLRRCRGVIHSGAHGTNALALRAGLPSIIRPCLQDQLWHARRQEQLGTGIWVRGDRFDDATARLLDDHAMADRAASLGRMLAAEKGTSVACDAIEVFLHRR